MTPSLDNFGVNGEVVFVIQYINSGLSSPWKCSVLLLPFVCGYWNSSVRASAAKFKYYFFDKSLGTCMESDQGTCHNKWWNPFWKDNSVKFKVFLIS
jgi:hypothetical protein